MSKASKSLRREAARLRARFAPRGSASDRRPDVVRANRGLARHMVRVVRTKGQ